MKSILSRTDLWMTRPKTYVNYTNNPTDLPILRIGEDIEGVTPHTLYFSNGFSNGFFKESYETRKSSFSTAFSASF